MKATEIRDKIANIDAQLHQLSENVLNIEEDGIDIGYLRSKITSLVNTAKHIEGQLKYYKR